MKPLPSPTQQTLLSLVAAAGALCLPLAACKRSAATPPPFAQGQQSGSPQSAAMTAKPIDALEALRDRHREPSPPAAPCLPEMEAPTPAELLEQAAREFEQGHFGDSLECARSAGRLEPQNLASHHFRGAALAELGQLDEARTAYARALALDPEDPEVLRSAADLYIRRLGGRDDLELGLLYVRRALPRAEKGHDRQLTKELHLLAAMAQDDLGRPALSLAESERTLELDPKDREARRERGVALFELCRFDQSKQELEKLTAEEPDAWAEQYLGLIAERARDDASAQRHFAKAQALDPEAFRQPPPVDPGHFTAVVEDEKTRLPEEIKQGLAQADLHLEELPDVADLVATDPPLSPGILGLFRPPAEGAPAEARPAIILYRRNLARAVRTEEELRREVRDTLLHEVGHLNGEDDEQLRDRGL